MKNTGELIGADEFFFYIMTVSDTRNESNNKSGWEIQSHLETAGYPVAEAVICRDDKEEIESNIKRWLLSSTICGIILTGGTGISPRDITIETITPYFTKKLNGFGELFRYISYTEEVGSKAMLSRAAAGLVNNHILFALPGSVKAVKLAMSKLIIPEVQHIVKELTKGLKE